MLPVHPRLRARAAAAGADLSGGTLLPIDPLPYPGMVLLVSQARAVVTDSGGLQKEAYVLGVPCTTLRSETEWVETLANNWNVLAPEGARLETVALRGAPLQPRTPYFGTGDAAGVAAKAIADWVQRKG